MPSDDLPYWLANVPENQWPAECPEFLRGLSDRDQALVGRLDKDYQRLTWPEVKEVIGTAHCKYVQYKSVAVLSALAENQLDRFVRVPSDLRKYLEYNAKLKKRHGSVMDFVVKERLKWTDLKAKDMVPFSDPATTDLRILYNDWPYGIDERIVHLVVWTKFALDDDPETNELSSRMSDQIEEYVSRTFRQKVPAENVIWFKNWKSLKSIKSVEHFHVMLYDPDQEFVEQITQGDVPLSKTIQT